MKSFARFIQVAALAAGLALAAGTVAPPESQKAKAKTTKTAPKEAAEKAQQGVNTVEMVAAAYKPMEMGEAQKLPEAYIRAARLFLLLDKSPKSEAGKSEFKAKTEDGKAIADAKNESNDALSYKEADKCFEEAQRVAASQKDKLAALEAAIRKEPLPVGDRGALGGPKVVQKAIGAGQTHTHTINFETTTPGSIGFTASHPMECKMKFGNFTHFDQVVQAGAYTWKPKPLPGNVKMHVITVHNVGKAAGTYRIFAN